MAALGRILAWTLTIGGLAFATGFLGPIILDPDSNQGPLLGIFITGPLGVVAGFIAGVVSEVTGFRGTPRDAWRGLRRRLSRSVVD